MTVKESLALSVFVLLLAVGVSLGETHRGALVVEGSLKDRPNGQAQLNQRRRAVRRRNQILRRGGTFTDRFLSKEGVAGLPTTPERVCDHVALDEEDYGKEFGTTCQCSALAEDGTVTMMCIDTSCSYCNVDLSVCERFSYGVTFDTNGEAIAFIERDEYIKGKDDVVEYIDGHDTCHTSINGDECVNCSFITCSTGEEGYLIECSNLESGDDFDSCYEDDFETEGALMIYHADEFLDCIPLELEQEPGVELEQDNYVLEICETEALETEGVCECIPDTSQNGGVLMTCKSTCTYCDDSFEICGDDIYEKYFEPLSGDVGFVKSTATYSRGRTETLVLLETQCDSGTCQACSFEIDSTPCSSCTIQECQGSTESPMYGALVECDGAVLDFCKDEPLQPDRDDGPLVYFSSNVDQCTSEPIKSCLERLEYYESLESDPFACECVDIADGGMDLRCDASCGYFCNAENNICGSIDFVHQINPEGSVAYRKTQFEYVLGRNESMVLEEFRGGSCTFSVDSKQCQSCQLRSCPDGRTAPFLDCQNFEDGAVFDMCENQITVESGVFEYFDTGKFNECIDISPPENLQCIGARTLSPDDSILLESLATSQTDSQVYTDPCTGVSNHDAGLWYQVNGTALGLSISSCTGNDEVTADISVYSGTCNDLHCVTSFYGGCNDLQNSATWFAEEEMYYIRVSGANFKGNIPLTLQVADIASESCEKEKFRLEAEGVNEIEECLCDKRGSSASLSCVDSDCHYCSADGSICLQHSYGSTFDLFGIQESKYDTFKYTAGRNETVKLIEYQSGGCHVSVDGVSCSSCDLVTCPYNRSGYRINCQNLGLGSTFDSCFLADETELFGFLYQDTFDECVHFEEDYSFDACVAESVAVEDASYQSGKDKECECSRDRPNSTSTLHCTNAAHIIPNESDCPTKISGASFNGGGKRLLNFEQYEFQNHTIYLETFNSTCSVSVDGEACPICEYRPCSVQQERNLGFLGLYVDCSEILDQGIFDECSPSTSSDGLLLALDSDAFSSCETVPLLEACETMRLDEEQQYDDIACECRRVSGTQADTYELSCINLGCYFCNDNNSVCGHDLYGAIMDESGVTQHFEGFQYVEGRSDFLHYFESASKEDEIPQCGVSVNGIECECNFVTCNEDGGNEHQGISVMCSHLSSSSSNFTTCEAEAAQEDIFAAFSISDFRQCGGMEDPLQVCLDSKASVEARDLLSGTICQCNGDTDTGYTLSCADTNCQYCTEDRDECALYSSYGGMIDSTGQFVSFFDNYDFLSGKTEHLFMEEDTAGCVVSIDGNECTECSIVSCFDTEKQTAYQGYLFDCSNVRADSVYRCGEGTEAFKSIADSSFSVCLQYDGDGFDASGNLDMSDTARGDDYTEVDMSYFYSPLTGAPVVLSTSLLLLLVMI